MIRFYLNSETVVTDAPEGRSVLDYLRRDRALTGTKEGCREGDCGACMVLLGMRGGDGIGYRAATACLLPLGEAHGKHLLTIEGLNRARLNPVQAALVEFGAIQCGFCTPGIVIALTAYLLDSPTLDMEHAQTYLGGNLCRCTGYAGIKRAAARLNRDFPRGGRTQLERLAELVEREVLPDVCAAMPGLLAAIPPRIRQAGGTRVAGGTDLFVQQPERLEHMALDLAFDRSELHGIREEDGLCVIGAGTSAEEIRTSPLLRRYFPDLPHDFDLVCSEAVRGFATVGGNLVNASPIADMAVFFLACDADLVLADGGRRRTLPLRQFYLGYKALAKHEGEWIEALRFRLPAGDTRFSFEKISKRRYLDIASVNSALQLRVEGNRIVQAHLSAGGVAPHPLYLSDTSTRLAGERVDAAFESASAWAMEEIHPIDDVRGSADYKRRLLGQIVKAHFFKLFPGRFGEWTA